MSRYINAENLWKEAFKEFSFKERSVWYKIFDIITSAQTADVKEVIHGKWLTTDAYPHRVYCSVCYETNIYNEKLCFEKNKFPICCMWCGAKNELKEDDE